MLEINKIHQGDCLELMKDIPDKSVDMVLCDLPYGTTACKWDSIINLKELWKHYRRIIKPNGAIVLTCSQPFTSILVNSNLLMFRYEWIWKKSKASNFLLARKQPLKEHENIVVFSKKRHNYYPQKTDGKPYFRGGIKDKHLNPEVSNTIPNYHKHIRQSKDGKRFPRTIQKFTTAEFEGKFHPTQKPVKLFEYLIKTYTQEDDVILDNAIGSGTTAIACLNTKRNFIGIELDKEYVKVAEKRIKEVAGCKAESDDGIPPTNKLVGILPKIL